MQYYLYVANCRDYRLRVFNKFFNQMQSIPVKAAIYRFSIKVHHHAVKLQNFQIIIFLFHQASFIKRILKKCLQVELAC